MARQVLTLPDLPATFLTESEGDARYAPAGHDHSSTYVDVAGDTMTGPLTVNADGLPLVVNRADGTTNLLTVSRADSEVILGTNVGLRIGGPGGAYLTGIAGTPRYLDVWADVRANGAVSPNTDNSRDLGAVPYNKWRVLYAHTVDLATSLRFRQDGTQAPDTTLSRTAAGALRVDTTLGVGVNPAAWASGTIGFQVGQQAYLQAEAAGSTVALGVNTVQAAAGTVPIVGGQAAARLVFVSPGAIWLQNAPAVGAGVAQTFTTRFNLAPTGTLTLTPDAGQTGLSVNTTATYGLVLTNGGGITFHEPTNNFTMGFKSIAGINLSVTYLGNSTGLSFQNGGQIAHTGQLTLNGGNAMHLSTTVGNLYTSVAGGVIHPLTDNQTSMGHPSYRWTSVCAVAGTINTSSRKYKDPLGDVGLEAALRAVLTTPARRFRYKGQERIQSGYYLEEADPLFTIGPDESSPSNDAGVLLAAIQALCARLGITA